MDLGLAGVGREREDRGVPGSMLRLLLHGTPFSPGRLCLSVLRPVWEENVDFPVRLGLSRDGLKAPDQPGWCGDAMLAGGGPCLGL